MTRRSRPFAALFGLVLLGLAAASDAVGQAPGSASASDRAALIDGLRRGGFVIFLRHARRIAPGRMRPGSTSTTARRSGT
jgi:hypothetical protein